MESVEGATIRITTTGSIRDPEVGDSIEVGTGSGFFISADGLAVTNQHVVTGAASIEVQLAGDDGKTYPASVVGVSECDDLALIDVDVDGNVPYLDWFDGDISTGLEVWAAGFPLGDPEYTLTKGIISKDDASGEVVETASVDRVVEHDANLQPGSSGGPLVDTDGRVVAVNFAGGAVASSTEQFFGIAADVASEVVDGLRGGDGDALGINGWPVSDDALGITGIWVAAVEPGTPASDAGVLAGDVLLEFDGMPLAAEGGYGEYCDVVRSAGEGAIAVEVLRFDTNEVLTGEFRGRPLDVSGSISSVVGGSTEIASGEAYTEWVTLVDDTGTISVEVPAAWSDVDLTPANTEAGEAPFIQASTDIDEFDTSYRVPGMVFAAVPTTSTVESLLTEFAPAEGECTDEGIDPYEDARFVGEVQVWADCAGADVAYVVVVSELKDGSPYRFVTIVQAVSTADIDALERILDTFNLTS